MRQVTEGLQQMVQEAQATVNRAESSQFVQGLPLMRQLSKNAGRLVVGNIEVLTDMVLDEILEETVGLLNSWEEEQTAADSGVQASKTVQDYEAMLDDIRRRVDAGYTLDTLQATGGAPSGVSGAVSTAATMSGPQPPSLFGEGELRHSAPAQLPIEVLRRIERFKRRYGAYATAINDELHGMEHHELVEAIAEDFIEELIANTANEMNTMVDDFTNSLVAAELSLNKKAV